MLEQFIIINEYISNQYVRALFILIGFFLISKLVVYIFKNINTRIYALMLTGMHNY